MMKRAIKRGVNRAIFLNCQIYFDGMEGKKNGDEEKREKINEVPRTDKMSDIEQFTK